MVTHVVVDPINYLQTNEQEYV